MIKILLPHTGTDAIPPGKIQPPDPWPDPPVEQKSIAAFTDEDDPGTPEGAAKHRSTLDRIRPGPLNQPKPQNLDSREPHFCECIAPVPEFPGLCACGGKIATREEAHQFWDDQAADGAAQDAKDMHRELARLADVVTQGGPDYTEGQVEKFFGDWMIEKFRDNLDRQTERGIRSGDLLSGNHPLSPEERHEEADRFAHNAEVEKKIRALERTKR